MKEGYLQLKISELNDKCTQIDQMISMEKSKIELLEQRVGGFKELIKKLQDLDEFKDRILKPLYTYNGKSSYHLYVVRIDFDKLTIFKEGLFNSLRERNIGLQLHYVPINKQPYYRGLGYGDENTPVMDKYYEECFSLPMYPKMTDAEQEYVIDALYAVLEVS